MNYIFVFGSNLAGVHGAGAAYDALKKYGAKMHVGKGLTGRSYALPTKGLSIQTLPLGLIKRYVEDFLEVARTYPELTFKVTRVGCGLAGWRDVDIAPLFLEAPENCHFDTAWMNYVTHPTIKRVYWGHQ